MNLSPKRILIIYANSDPPETMRNTITHHLQVLEYSDIKHDLVYYNSLESATSSTLIDDSSKQGIPDEIRNASFDAVILHYTFLSFRTLGLPFYQWKLRFDWIRDLDFLKIAIPQDEGDCAELLDEWLFDMGISVIFSVHYNIEGPLYKIMRDNADIYPCLPGYIDEASAKKCYGKLLPIAEREKDIAYRARRLPPWFGKAGQLKYRIADVVVDRAETLGFNVDISTKIEDSIFSNDWLHFLSSSKAVIGSQGGYSAINWRGEIKAQIHLMLRKNPMLSFEEISARMPVDWDDYQLFTVTPRHFEAIITKTCQVLIEGEYKGVLKADEHYIPLKQDFSNIDETLEKLRDDPYMQRIVDRAYDDIYLSGKYTYRTFAKRIDEILVEHQQMEQKTVKVNPNNNHVNKTIAVMERQLIAERHQNALLYATFPDMADQLADRITSSIIRRVKTRLRQLLPLAVVLVLVSIASITVVLLN